jgi:hypothetical protein
MLSPVILLSYPFIGILLLVFVPLKKNKALERNQLLIALVVTL